MSVVFVVSGEEDIRDTANLLRSQGYSVVHDEEVEECAQVALSGGRYLVVAHGSQDGSITIARSSGETTKWLWVNMPDPPSGGRVYLYACHAGEKLVPALDACEAFGHVDLVPMASDDAEHCVSQFLAQAASLVASEGFDRTTWQRTLCAFLDVALQDAYDNEGAMNDFYVVHLLRKSLRFGEPMWE